MIELMWNADTADATFESDIISAVQTALSMEKRCGDVCVQIVDEESIRTLNRDFRHIDRITDVLTFPAWEGEALLSPPDGYLGDIAICYARAVEQAQAYGHSLRRELCFLAVHGALHLCGYDHMEASEEQIMKDRQDAVLHQLRVER